MSGQPFYITTAIDYVNSKPHLGTAYEKITADAIARYRRLLGDDVLFLMGNDEHSLKVASAAEKLGLTPLAYCDKMEETFRSAWAALDIEFDDFIRTTQERHKITVREMIERIRAADDIYQAEYEGWYCVGCEAFKNTGELIDGKCPEHLTLTPEWLKEKNWFFRLSKYGDLLLDHYDMNPEFILPIERKNELVEVIKSGLKDLSISRESATWGIPMPFDPSAVVYVWFDALINYVSATGWPNETEKFEKFWPTALHIVGKDITRFHAVIWPAMLMSAGLPLPKRVFGHGFVNFGGDRMSKSKGTIVDPKELAQKYGADALRWYVMTEGSYGRDIDYTEDRLTTRTNSDLANSFGNLASRTISMILKSRGGVVPQAKGESLLKDTIDRARVEYGNAMGALDLKGGGEAIMSIAQRANLLVDQEAPWALAKDPSKADRLDRVLYDLAEACRVIGVLLAPFMPKKAAALRALFKYEKATKDVRLDDALFGRLAAGTVLEKAEPLFPRIEPPKVAGA